MQQARILFIDAYDSFSNNITTLLKNNLPVTVEVVHIDDPRFVFNDDAFQSFLNKFDAVVAGPGPGHPANVDDVGLIGRLWSLPDDRLLPILGICLGFQSLALAIGAKVERLREPRHGLVTRVTHCGRDVFAGFDSVHATQYHSLHVRFGGGKEISSGLKDPWRPYGELVPLAWDLSDSRNGPILMGLRHHRKPFWGVQYHPESICSNGGRELILSWWREVCEWNVANHRKPCIDTCFDSGRTSLDAEEATTEPRVRRQVHWKAMRLVGVTETADVVDMLRTTEKCDPILLESGVRKGRPINPETGRYSIIGLHYKCSLQVRWCCQSDTITTVEDGGALQSRYAPITDVFATLESIVDIYRAHHGLVDVPFWGGLMGFISYEAGLETIDVKPAGADAARPDVWFVLVERSVVLDHVEQVAYVQTIREDDEAWLTSTTNGLLQVAEQHTESYATGARPAKADRSIIAEPDQQKYCRKVSECQSHLRAGSSYELCLTDQTFVRNWGDPWQLYCKLRHVNPAPFGAFMHLQSNDAGLDVISSSPERFLSWSRDGKCQFRPIKGTVKKTPDMTRAKAEELLGSEKERAENLMIVDLIRHDLSGVAGYVLSPLHRTSALLLYAAAVTQNFPS